ncbi:hypothetical protein [Yersinia intermedia]|uniref:hypothetical protein n=1 Tax=Yersinia intermedia TaxID=631 RepID=UPI001CFC49E0|nr:hypothetical protein [Yersinia intermedia]MCB5311898.1 hypothetical protein [Yersinia intermedia]MCB5325377.1 hypothetical protein [Yersinia intermedia]
MPRYGLRIRNPDGSSFIFNEKTTMSKILGSGSKGLTFGEWYTGIQVPVGHDYVLWLSSYAWINYNVSNSQWVPSGYAYNQPYLDGNRVLRVNSVNYNTAIPATHYGVFSWPQGHAPGRYGLRVNGKNNFSSISDVSSFSVLLWKGEVDIYNGWLPQAINSAFTMDRVVCFFYTTDQSKTICMSPDPGDRVYKVWNVNGGQSGGAIRAKVCIFGNGPIVKAKYGLQIRNSAGQVVYNSGTEIFAKPVLTSLANLSLGQLRSVPGITRPMYAPSNIGALYSYPWQVDVWVNSNGYQLCPAWGWSKNQPKSHGPYTYYVSDIPILSLDASDYFNF